MYFKASGICLTGPEFNEFAMSGASLRSKPPAFRTASPKQTALYTYDMLMSLKRLAELNKQERLAALIEEAADEAQNISHAKPSSEK